MRIKLILFVLVCLGMEQATGQTITKAPNYGTFGTFITIEGKNFSLSGVTVKFNGILAGAGTAVTGTGSIQAKVPANATKGFITVQNNNAPVQAQSPNMFTPVGTKPFVDYFDPNNAVAGTEVTIHGANFTANNNTVKFGGVTAQCINPTIIDVLVAYVPFDAVSGPITVINANGTSDPSAGMYYATPAITGISPTAAQIGATVTLTGKNFLGVSEVKLNFTTIPFRDVTYIDNSHIKFVIPPYASKGKISVKTPQSTVFSTGDFAILPNVTGFNPTIGGPDTIVTIYGTTLTGVTSVKFGSASASPINTSDTQVTVKVPVGATSGFITVVCPDGSFTTTEKFLVPPTITKIDPTKGEPGTIVTITGTSLDTVNNVTFFGGTNASIRPGATATSLQVTVPPDARPGPITVRSPAGAAESADYFYRKPVISGFSPTSGVPGTVVEIKGTYFEKTAGVYFGGIRATNFTTNINNTIITAHVPSNAITGPIRILSYGGDTSTSTNFVIEALKLSIEQFDENTVAISWPAGSAAYALQYASQLKPAETNTWLWDTNTPQLLNGRILITNSILDAPKYYRLKKQQ